MVSAEMAGNTFAVKINAAVSGSWGTAEFISVGNLLIVKECTKNEVANGTQTKTEMYRDHILSIFCNTPSPQESHLNG